MEKNKKLWQYERIKSLLWTRTEVTHGIPRKWKKVHTITVLTLEYWDTIWNTPGLHLIFSTEFAYKLW